MSDRRRSKGGGAGSDRAETALLRAVALDWAPCPFDAGDPPPSPRLAPVPVPDDPSAQIEPSAVAQLLAQLRKAELRADAATRRAERAEALAFNDPLTGIPNRRQWNERLATEQNRAARAGTHCALAVIDLDDFKQVNDSQGHLMGDLLLILTASTLQAAVRSHDLVARLGGDEFGVLVVDYGEDVAGSLQERLVSGLRDAGIAASVGCAVQGPGLDLLETVAEADRRMYAAKRQRHTGTPDAVDEARRTTR